MFANANVDLAIVVLAIGAVAMLAPYDHWSLSYLGSDVGLFLGGVVAYWLSSQDFSFISPICKGKGPVGDYDVSKYNLPTLVKLFFCIIVAGNICLLFCAIAAFCVLLLYIRLETPENSPQESCAVSDQENSLDLTGNECEDVLPTLVETSDAVRPQQQHEPQLNVIEHVLLMEEYASQRDLCGTMRTFRLIQQSGECISSPMYNIVLQAYINCGNVQAAEDWMEEVMKATMADSNSFNILIKALVQARALTKAEDCLKDMRRAGLQPCTATFNELLNGFVQEGRFHESFNLLDNMHAWGVQASNVTINTIAKLVNESRNIDQSCGRIRRILQKYNLAGACTGASPDVPVALPRLAAVMYNAEDDESPPAPCEHEFQVTGSLAQIKAVRRTLKQHGFLDKNETDARPLDGHWETDYRLTVVIEGKVVRWSGQRASKLRYTAEDQSSCELALYGEASQGKLMSPPTAPDVRKTLMWDNGDIWSSYDGRVIGQDTLFCQTMTKTLRDEAQDDLYRAWSSAALKCVSKQALGVPSILEESIMQFLGNDLYYVRVQFASKWNPSHVDEDQLPLFDADADICVSISQRHPQVGLRHCWADRSVDSFGQRTLVNGEEVPEGSFSRHIGAVRWT